MQSLRGRLALIMAVIAVIIVVIASVTVVFVRWREATAQLETDVQFVTFDQSDSGSAAATLPEFTGGDSEFMLVLGGVGEVLDSAGPVTADLIEFVLADLYPNTVDSEVLDLTYYTSQGDSAETIIAGVGCVDLDVCDTIIVGADEVKFSSFFVARLGWVVALALVAGLGAIALARWAVGRSLQPVERMRAEVAQISATGLDRRVEVPESRDELTALGQTFNETLGRLDVAVSANERFVADAAHELRSPLAGIRAAVEVEAKRTDSDLLEDVIDEVDRAGRLVDDLLILARRSAAPISREPVQMDAVVGEMLERYRRNGPSVSIVEDLEPVEVLGSTDDITRIVTNLVDNAIRHASAEVRVSTAAHEGAARVVVADDGPGISAADRQRVFERFARLDTARSRQTGGAGLGLAIVSDLVAAHGGSIEIVDSDLGGAAFVVTFPRHLARD